ncbi:MAG TPA: nitrate reductase [Spirochaetia bacterium]|nr:nitrate reductase [Spirochaetales bacterium]HRY80135.1 nitrate reductase [Spirochaetia bacterium]
MPKVVRTTCSYCSVGCNFDAVYDDEGKLVSFLPAKDYPVNRGSSCPKGFHLLKALEVPERGATPLLRNLRGDLEPVDWDRAISVFVERFKAVRDRHGPESAAFLSTGQIPMEEMALLGALFKFGMGFVHADGNTRQCMASAAVAYKQSFGFDAPPFCYEDLELTDLPIFVGANPVIAHPVLWARLKGRAEKPPVVVIDPRLTKTAREADLHMAVRPKGDLTLLYGLARILVEEDWIDRPFLEAHTEGFEEFSEFVRRFDDARVEAESGIPPARVRELAERIRSARAVSFWWTMGVNQSHQAVRTAQAIINLCLMTGNIGRPGTGPNSITGQSDAMGSRMFSLTTSLPAGRDFTKEADRIQTAAILGIDPGRIPSVNSLPYHKILEAVDEGRIKALWFVATNPAHSWIDKHTLLHRLAKLEFLVVQDLYPGTETAARAHLYLPAAGSAEKDGTMINSERRLGAVRKVRDAPGQALPDFEIFLRIARAWGCGDLFREWTDPEAAFRILQRLSAGRPCDFSGIRGYEEIRERGGIQWPFPASGADPAPQRRLFADGRFYTDSGRAKFLFSEPQPMPEVPDAEYPFQLITGRGSLVQWHTQTRTGKVAMLRSLAPAEAYADIHARDARRLGIAEGAAVRVRSRRGEVRVKARISDEVSPGQVFMPMHYPESNFLTFPAFDPYSAEPAYKMGAVALEAEP